MVELQGIPCQIQKDFTDVISKVTQQAKLSGFNNQQADIVYRTFVKLNILIIIKSNKI